jgi:signal transduction histidine kinase
MVGSDPGRAGVLLDELADEARAEIVEIRRLVDDLRPRVLDQLGLVSALRQRAASLSLDSTDGAPGPGALDQNGHPHAAMLRWSVEADDVEPLPAAVEVAAYRIVIEAVNNAAKHSQATTCRVSLARRRGSLEIEVSDDGTGVPADAQPGVGLGSMRERAEELGGNFTLTGTTTGTTILVRLPIDELEQPDQGVSPGRDEPVSAPGSGPGDLSAPGTGDDHGGGAV